MQKNYNSDLCLFSSYFPLISLNAISCLVYNLKIVQRYFGETPIKCIDFHFDYYVMGNPFGSPNSVDAILRNVSAILERQEQLDYKKSYTTTVIFSSSQKTKVITQINDLLQMSVSYSKN